MTCPQCECDMEDIAGMWVCPTCGTTIPGDDDWELGDPQEYEDMECEACQ